MKDFKGKVAVITGAASGIGFALAERCAKEGMKVVLADIEKDALAKAEKDIRASGAETLAVRIDVSKARDMETLAKKTLDTFGAVHLLFNNAGVCTNSTVWESTLTDWQWVLGVNLWGVIYGLHFFVPIMLTQKTECHVINTASVGGLTTYAGNCTYAVSKHGIVALSETLYRELEQRALNIGVSVLCPGVIKTNICESERNRPITLKNKAGEGAEKSDPNIQASTQLLKQLNENGMPPQQLADIVFNAIKEKKFYILPNTEIFKPNIIARLEDILQERNPAPSPKIN